MPRDGFSLRLRSERTGLIYGEKESYYEGLYAARYQRSEALVAGGATRHMILMNGTAAGFGYGIGFRGHFRERSAMAPWRSQLGPPRSWPPAIRCRVKRCRRRHSPEFRSGRGEAARRLPHVRCEGALSNLLAEIGRQEWSWKGRRKDSERGRPFGTCALHPHSSETRRGGARSSTMGHSVPAHRGAALY